MTYQNLNNKTHNHPGRRSKAEHQLVNLLKSEFPNLIITENNRSVLPSKLELDIYIPEFKFAIELNGPVHYLPIFGSEKLLKAQNKDYIKNKECIDMKISLMTIDISRLNSIKKSKEFIIQTFEEKIKPLILDFLVAGDELNVPFAL